MFILKACKNTTILFIGTLLFLQALVEASSGRDIQHPNFIEDKCGLDTCEDDELCVNGECESTAAVCEAFACDDSPFGHCVVESTMVASITFAFMGIQPIVS